MRLLFLKIFSLLAFSLLLTLIPNFSVKAQTDILFADGFENWTIKQTAWGTGEVPALWEPANIFSSAISNPTLTQLIAKSTDAQSGNFAYQLGGNLAVGGYTRRVDTFLVPPGGTLELIFFAKGFHTDEPFRARVYVQIFDSQDTFLGQLLVAIPNFLPTYTQLSGSHSILCNARYARLHYDKADFGTVIIDTVRVTAEPMHTSCPITTDVKPHSDPNSINLRSHGIIPVAVMTSEDFDAPALLDPSTFIFEDASSVKHAVEDVNGDGLTDLILFFKTQDTAIVCGQTLASLSGSRLDGGLVLGIDTIRTVGC